MKLSRPSSQDFPVRMDIRVRFRDLDSYRHVNNGTYLSFFEEIRIHYFSLIPAVHARIREIGVLEAMMELFPSTLVRAEVHFRDQAFLHEMITVGVRVSNIRKSFIDMEYGVFRKETGRPLAMGETTLLFLDKESFRPRRIPSDFIREMERIEERTILPARAGE